MLFFFSTQLQHSIYHAPPPTGRLFFRGKVATLTVTKHCCMQLNPRKPEDVRATGSKVARITGVKHHSFLCILVVGEVRQIE